MFWPLIWFWSCIAHGWEHVVIFRLHAVSEFDEKKRSCRIRLSHHNARRRKSQGVFPFNPERVYGKNHFIFLSVYLSLSHTYTTSFDGDLNVKCLLLQIKDSIQMLCGVPLVIQSQHRGKVALPWASREAMDLRKSSCLLVATTLYLRIKPQAGSQQGRTSFNLVFCTSHWSF